jgi:alkanesulfonate monooxygenase SsuD/methylene tetrahydromethanopterin reductase-like flavin-dependent oxidoreductase (luciferase family)
MLRLTARYADSWNTAWLGRAHALAAPRAALEAACAAEGRDPATLAVTVGVSVDYSVAGTPANAEDALSGSAEEVAAGLRGYEEAGVAQVICALTPTNAQSLARLAEALAVYRRLGS